MRRWFAGLAVLGLGLSGCMRDSPGPSADSRLTVVAAFYPLEEAAKQIGGDRLQVSNLTPPGAEPHDIELTTGQLEEIFDADVVLYLGRGFQPSIEEAVDGAEGVVLDVLEGEELISEDTVDPHVWLDPPRWSEVVDRIREALIDADGDSAEVFDEAARDYTMRIEELDVEFKEGLNSCDRDLMVTSHSAFAYLAERYGLRQESISGVSHGGDIDPEQLGELSDLVEKEGVTTIFAETLVSVEGARTLARETGAQVATLDPIEGLTPDQIENGEDYASIMRENLEVLSAGLGCK